jgi:hypothetical protein
VDGVQLAGRSPRRSTTEGSERRGGSPSLGRGPAPLALTCNLHRRCQAKNVCDVEGVRTQQRQCAYIGFRGLSRNAPVFRADSAVATGCRTGTRQATCLALVVAMGDLADRDRTIWITPLSECERDSPCRFGGRHISRRRTGALACGTSIAESTRRIGAPHSAGALRASNVQQRSQLRLHGRAGLHGSLLPMLAVDRAE